MKTQFAYLLGALGAFLSLVITGTRVMAATVDLPVAQDKGVRPAKTPAEDLGELLDESALSPLSAGESFGGDRKPAIDGPAREALNEESLQLRTLDSIRTMPREPDESDEGSESP